MAAGSYVKMADLGHLAGEMQTWYKVVTTDGTTVEAWGDELDAKVDKHGGGIKEILLEEQRERKTAAEIAGGWVDMLSSALMPKKEETPSTGAPATVTAGDIAYREAALAQVAAEKRARTNLMIAGSIGAAVLGGIIFFLMGKR